MSKRLRWLFPCFPPKKSTRPVDSPSDSGLELRGRIDPVPTRDPEPPVNTETVLHGSGSATPNSGAEPSGIVDIAPNIAPQLDHVDAPPNPTPKHHGAGTASPNPTPELSDPTGSATVVAPEPHSPVDMASTAVPDPSQPVSVAPTPEPGLVSAIDSAQDPTPELNSSVDSSTNHRSPAKPTGRFTLSDNKKALLKGIGKSLLSVAKVVSESFPPLAVVVESLELVVDWVEEYEEIADMLKALEERIKKIQELLPAMPAGEKEQRYRQTLKKTLDDAKNVLDPIKEQNILRKVLTGSEISSTIEEYVKKVDQALADYQISILQHLLDINLKQLTYDENNMLDKLPRSKDAAFNAASGHDRRGCLPGTRVEVLAALKDWALSGTQQVYWLNGHAGSGKSTIAQSFAQWLFQEQMLGASFFCSRNSPQRRDRNLIFPTLAFQLATSLNRLAPRYRAEVINALKRNSDIGSFVLQSQIDELLVRPLDASQMKTVIVLDALDECEDSQSTSIILSVIAGVVDRIPSVRFFITGRPEPRIQAGFRLNELKDVTGHIVLHQIQKTSVYNDISLFVEVELKEIKHARYECSFPEVWPDRYQIEALTIGAAGLFIFAATVVKFIGEAGDDPCDRLDMSVASLQPRDSELDADTRPTGYFDDHSDPYAELNALYLRILKDAFHEKKNTTRAQEILGLLVVARDDLSPSTITQLLPIDRNASLNFVRASLSLIQSVVHVPDDAMHPIRFYHKSFPDFLTDRARCTDERFTVDLNRHHFALSQRCFEIMRVTLKKNICGLPRYSMNADLALTTRDSCIPEATRYSCRYWAVHVLADNCRVDHFDILEPLLSSFLYAQLLYWFEVLGILRELRRAVEGLNTVHTWLASLNDPRCKSLLTAIADGQRFVLNAFDTIQESVVHMYHSHLPLSPRASIFANGYYLRDHVGEAKVLIGVNETWSPEIRSIHTNRQIHVIEYSHDGTMLAAASAVDATVWIFRAATGERMAEFSPDFEDPLSGYGGLFSFSADGRILAVTQSSLRSMAQRIALWDITTGTKLIVLPPIHWLPVCTITFSPTNSPLLVSIDMLGLIVLWNTSDLNSGEFNEHHKILPFSGDSTGGGISWIPGPTHRNKILVGFQDGRIEMRDIITDPNRCLRVFRVDRGDGGQQIVGITAWGDGCWFASHSKDRITVHNIETAEAVISFPIASSRKSVMKEHYLFASTSGNTASPMLAFADGDTISLAFISHVTDNSQRTKSDIVRLQPESYADIAFSPNGQFIATSYDNHDPGTVKICDTSALAASPPATGHGNDIDNLRFPHFSPDGRFIVSSSGPLESAAEYKQTIAVWSVAGIAASCQFEIINCHELRDMGRIVDVVFLSDSRYIVSVDHRGVMDLWDWRQKQILHTDRTAQIYELSKTCTAETKYTLFPFTDGPPGFSLTYCTAAKDGGGICCWLVETNPPGLKLLVNGRLPISPTRFANPPPSTGRNPTRIAFEDEPLRIYRHGQIPDGLNISPPSLAELIVEYKSTRRFSTPCEWGYELDWVEFENSDSKSEGCLSPYDEWTCVGPEIPILVSNNEGYIMNKYGKKLFLVPPAYRGPGRWHEKKLLLWNEGRMLLLDFSQINIDGPDDVLF